MIEHGILLSHAHDQHVINCPDRDVALRVAQDIRFAQPGTEAEIVRRQDYGPWRSDTGETLAQVVARRWPS